MYLELDILSFVIFKFRTTDFQRIAIVLVQSKCRIV